MYRFQLALKVLKRRVDAGVHDGLNSPPPPVLRAIREREQCVSRGCCDPSFDDVQCFCQNWDIWLDPFYPWLEPSLLKMTGSASAERERTSGEGETNKNVKTACTKLATTVKCAFQSSFIQPCLQYF